ncbi:MAG: 2Fe-2S iron-sulfur cluster binding domain-containing protein [Algicola sp.]|nr:2Fe-2S iron-sulfur cluster binding domain-containing protein [Algicola sp.]
MSTEFFPLTISKVERLTKDAVALSFALPDELKDQFSYIQGQHLTLKADIDGEDIRRSYSICSSVAEQQLQVGIKTINGGVFSNYANKALSKGMTLEVMPPQGHFYTELNENNEKHYLFIAVGSGITPNLSHIRSILATEPKAKVTLLYGNKSTPMMMFREKLNFIKNQYLVRYQQINLFTREENDAVLFNGRITAQKLIDLDKARVIEIKQFSDVFICGPEEMILDVEAAFKHWGFSEEQIHYELFFSGSAEKEMEASQARRAEEYGEKISIVSVKVGGRKTFIDLAMGGANVLDAAMENGADLPYSCKGGVCATCKAKVIKGKVEMDLNHSLTEQEVADGYILTCQAHPVSDEVEIDFDF